MSTPTCRLSTHGGEFLKRQESICAKRAEITVVILRKADEATAWTMGRNPPGSITFDRGSGNPLSPTTKALPAMPKNAIARHTAGTEHGGST